jgi:ribosomal protein S18 acetylase RimI-like enzyme
VPNDNLHALRFYQKRGFVLVALHRNALEASRKLKPEIPLVGIDGIPIRDEIELELVLDDKTRAEISPLTLNP